MYCQTDSTFLEFEKEFNNFNVKIDKEFIDFRDKSNQEFAAFLKQSWSKFYVESPIEKPIDDKPITPTKFIPNKGVTPKDTVLEPLKVIIEKEDEKEEKPSAFEDSVNQKSLTGELIDILFYGTTFQFRFEKQKQIFCKGILEQDVSTFWSEISKTDYQIYIQDFINYKARFSLNDWALYELVVRLSQKLYSDKSSLIAFQFFCLNQLGYDAKVARADQSLVLLLNMKNEVFGISYIKITDKFYYIMNSNSNKGIYTFSSSFNKQLYPIDLKITKSITCFENVKTRTIRFGDKPYVFSIDYSPELVDFYNNLPLTDFPVFFNSTISNITHQSLIKNIKPLIVGKTEMEAVAFLLSFVQNGFEYKTDAGQFGKEKYFFVEDILHYPFSDCEDRSVFFSHLVKDLLGLEVIGLLYENHIATAVRFNQSVSGDAIHFDGNSYVVCDPTYIGAFAGMSMPQYEGVRPTIIKID